jgi:8-hydroxy-5-deazaflavin:NADPH oxidoreductase
MSISDLVSASMRIAIIGSGRLGRALGTAWARHGHRVTFGVRDAASKNAQETASTGARVTSIRDAIADADVLTLATPFAKTQDALQACGDLTGRIVIDCTNPVIPGFSLAVGHTTSGAEQVASWAPGARVVKAFNSLGSPHVGHPVIGNQAASMFFCGDDAQAKLVVAALGSDLGFDMVDAGPLIRARIIEPMALLWIVLAYAEGNGPDIAFRLLRESPATRTSPAGG